MSERELEDLANKMVVEYVQYFWTCPRCHEVLEDPYNSRKKAVDGALYHLREECES